MERRSSFSAELLSRRDSERAVVLPLVCLLIVALIGLVALAVDIGAHYVRVQRSSVVLDLAALSASDLQMRGAAADEVENHVRYVVSANDSFRASEAGFLLQDEKLQITVSEDVNQGLLKVSRETPLSKYFGGVFGAATITSDIGSTAAYDLAPSSDAPVHLILMIESSQFSDSMYGEGCLDGFVGISCLNESDETAYCDSGCASALDVAKEAVRALTRGLSKADRVSLIDYSGAAKVLAKEIIPGPDLASEIEGLLSEIKVEEKGFEALIDPAVPLLLAQRLLDTSQFNGNPSLVMLTTAQPFFSSEGIRSPYNLILNQHVVNQGIPSGYVFGGMVNAGPIVNMTPYLNKLRTWHDWGGTPLECAGDSFEACEALQIFCWEDMDDPDCQSALERCEGNPATFLEQLAGVLASSIQNQHFARMYSVNVAKDMGLENPGFANWPCPTCFVDDRWKEAAINSPLRRRNFLVDLAGDQSTLPYGTENRLSCAGARPPEMQGRYYEASPSGSKILQITRDMLRHARRPQEGDSEWGDFRSRLIEDDEV
jgi:hypothetical protein